MLELYPGMEKLPVFAHYQCCMHERIPQRFEESYAFTDGSTHWYTCSLEPVPEGIFVLSLDITESKRVEEALKLSEEKFRLSFMTGLDAFYWSTLEDGKIIEINPIFEDVFGYPREEAIGRTSLQLGLYHDPVDRERMISELKAKGQVKDLELKGKKKDGKIITVSLSTSRMSIGDQQYILGVIRDITERKRVEQQREILYQVLRAVSSQLDAELVAHAAVETIVRLTGYPHVCIALPDEEGAHWIVRGAAGSLAAELGATYLIHKGVIGTAFKTGQTQWVRDVLEDPNYVNDVRAPGASVLRSEFVALMRRGDDILGALNIESDRADAFDDEDARMIQSAADIISLALQNARLYREAQQEISERKRAEEEVRQLNAELEKRVDERTLELRQAQEKLIRQEKLAVLGQLAGGVGHELRNPLGIISSAIYYLKLVQPDMDPKTRQYYGMIEQEVRNSEKIIADLLDFARVETSERKRVSVPELVKRTLARFPVPESVNTSLDLPKDLPLVFADLRQMEQVLGNLTVNACQAMVSLGSTTSVTSQKSATGEAKGGRLIISARNKKGMVAIAVTDTGVGIPPENMSKLFEPLFSTKSKGIGLGLTVSKKLAEANGGRIEVKSTVGKGSTFTLFLPVEEIDGK
jgi:PAS domain S-box-containing protein